MLKLSFVKQLVAFKKKVKEEKWFLSSCISIVLGTAVFLVPVAQAVQNSTDFPLLQLATVTAISHQVGLSLCV